MENLFFEGSRLVIHNLPQTDQLVIQYKLPNLKKLHTEVEFLEYPSVQELGLVLDTSSGCRLIEKVPKSVEVLSLFMNPMPIILSGVHAYE